MPRIRAFRAETSGSFNCFCLLLWLIGTAQAQDGARHWDPALDPVIQSRQVLKACEPGKKVELSFADTSLFVDLRWVSDHTVVQINRISQGTCPTHSVHGVKLFFYMPAAPDIRSRFAMLPHYLLIEQLRHQVQPDAARPDAIPGSRRTLPDGGYVEEIVRIPNSINDALAPSAKQRTYRIQHPTPNNSSALSPILVGCGGTPSRSAPGRQCNAIYAYSSDLWVRYEFRQDRTFTGLAWPTPGGVITEPDGLLDFDAGVRAFLEELRDPERRY